MTSQSLSRFVKQVWWITTLSLPLWTILVWTLIHTLGRENIAEQVKMTIIIAACLCGFTSICSGIFLLYQKPQKTP